MTGISFTGSEISFEFFVGCYWTKKGKSQTIQVRSPVQVSCLFKVPETLPSATTSKRLLLR